MNYELGIKKEAGEMKFWEWLFLLFIFLLPWQTRLILRPGTLNGGNWEYGMLGVYGTEMLLWLVMVIWGIEKILKREIKEITEIRKLRKLDIKKIISLISVIFLISLSIFAASDKMVAWQSWRYIFEAIIVFFLIGQFGKRIIPPLSGGNLPPPLSPPSPQERGKLGRGGQLWLVWSFLAGLAVQSILAIWQFLFQSTFATRLLGLTNHFPWQAGSAVLEGGFGRWLRAYGGLPHPNILGGYLVIGMFLIILIILELSPDQGREIEEIKEITEIRKLRKLDIKKILLFIVYCLLLTALFFTFSRSAWLAVIIGLLVYWFISLRKKIIFKSFNLLILSLFLLFTFYFLLFQPLTTGRLAIEGRLEVQSTSERLSGYAEAWQLFKNHPLLGTGLGNYTLAVHNEIDSSRPAWAYQPVHNVIVLAIAELGIFGTLFFICFFVLLFYCFIVKEQLFILFFVPCSLFLVLCLLDHYLWSLYSGWMLLAVGMGLGLANFKEIS